jgi:hypothetical protein
VRWAGIEGWAGGRKRRKKGKERWAVRGEKKGWSWAAREKKKGGPGWAGREEGREIERGSLRGFLGLFELFLKNDTTSSKTDAKACMHSITW